MRREQLLALGMTRGVITQRVRSGAWTPVSTGVYRLTSGPADWDARAHAGLLIGGGAAVLGGLAAAHRHGFAEAPEVIEVRVPAAVHRRAPGYTFVRMRTMPKRVGSLAATTVETTAIDLCSRDPQQAIGWLTTVLRERRTTLPRLRDEVAARAWLPGRRLLTDFLSDDVEGLESPLEHRFVTLVCRPHGLPRGLRQVRTRTGCRRDVVIQLPGGVLVIELDGRRGHENEPFRDLRRDNEAALAGAMTLRFGWDDVVLRPCAVAAQIVAAMRSLGWTGAPTCCSSCR